MINTRKRGENREGKRRIVEREKGREAGKRSLHGKVFRRIEGDWL